MMMVPDLLDATRDYWRKLDALEAAYQRGEVSLEEVDAQVEELMTQLGQRRRASLRILFDSLRRTWNEQREVIVGLGLVGILTCVWMTG